MKAIAQTNSLTEKRKIVAKRTWTRTSLLFFVFSFALPYLMAIFFFLTSRFSWKDIFNKEAIIGYTLIGVIFLFCFILFAFFLYYKNFDIFVRKSTKWVLVTTFILPFLTAPILANELSNYAVPLLFCGLIVMVLLDEGIAYIFNAVVPILFFLSYYMLNPTADLYELVASALVQIIAGELVLVFVRKRYTRLSFLAEGVLVGLLVAIPLAFIVSALQAGSTWKDYVTSAFFSFISILISLAFFMMLTPLYEVFFRLYSNFRLEELCAANSPLMEKLAKEAPGTYNHSIAMSILAQDCAKAIGENPALAKAGACYHDIGKIYNPVCFSENQTTYNPHDNYIPEVSVAMITRHTKEGASIIRKARLPEALAQIAEEHHGDQTVSYFLNKSRKMTDVTMDRDLFRYKGPRPSTKISGIIMIVDTVEAATRAQGINKDDKLFQEFIHKLITDKVNAKQFDDCPLTLKDLNIIEETLLKSVPAIYHQRIKYTK